MANKNTVTLTFAGDASQLSTTTKSVSTSLQHVGTSAHAASKEVDNFGTAAKKTGQTARGTKEIFEGLGKAAGLFGIDLPIGQIGDAAGAIGGLGRGFHEVAEGISGDAKDFAKSLGLMRESTEAATTAQEGLDVALEANPIGIAIAAVALLAAGFYLLWEKSETFRKGVTDTFQGLKLIIGAFWTWLSGTSVFKDLVSMAKAIAGPIEGVFQAIGATIDAVVSKIDAAMGAAQSLANKLVGKSATITTPGLQKAGSAHEVALGNTIAAQTRAADSVFNGFATGGPVHGGTPILVGERGPEIFTPPGGGGMITPNGAMGGGGGSTVIVQFAGLSTDKLIDALRQGVKAKGGNVQTVLGANF